MLIVAASGCSAAVGTTNPDAGADASRSDAAAAEAGPTDPVVCSGGTAATFPSLDRRCSSTSDCALFEHQSDCCGNMAALGARATERARFDAAEQTCRAMLPGCGCAGGTYRTDDGMSTGTRAAIVVECREERCTTTVRTGEPCGAVTCALDEACMRPCCGVPNCEAPPPTCVRIPPACATNPSCSCFESNPCPTGSCVGWENGRPLCICA